MSRWTYNPLNDLIKDEEEHTIAEMYYGGDIGERDGRIIATAPQMLQYIKDFLNEVSGEDKDEYQYIKYYVRKGHELLKELGEE